MFYRATNQESGSGIGLYILKDAVNKLGGQISFESETGVGTTFKVMIPNNPTTNL
jgi:signal transduction histidine kinase